MLLKNDKALMLISVCDIIFSFVSFKTNDHTNYSKRELLNFSYGMQLVNGCEDRFLWNRYEFEG